MTNNVKVKYTIWTLLLSVGVNAHGSILMLGQDSSFLATSTQREYEAEEAHLLHLIGQVSGHRNWMPTKDGEGYIIESQSSSGEPSLPRSSSIASVSPLLATYDRLQSGLVSLYGVLFDRLGHLFSRPTFSQLSKYLLYPFLSGLLSASIAAYRTYRRRT